MSNVETTTTYIGAQPQKPSPAPIGDNSSKFAADQLKAVIDRIERLEEDKKAVASDIRDIYVEAKGNGYDVKALRTIVRLRAMDTQKRQEAETILDTYMLALGML